MPNIKSQIKRTKTNEKRRLQRVSQKSALRTALKGVEAAVATNDVAAAQEAYKLAAKKLDKAVTKGLIHKNEASRRKSRLAQKVNGVTA
ncbi:30S ribosomal protein S20 [Ammoniphilus sp. CFH 90114]|uniref:30S ribosomal protein S20 n=1 Tax=Ammoniphilus sp. CFH 90114 TaxID=2493665 RepID=UPI00100F12FE|nr:30S ribosomal protein S20 [Ammoniphilus sp. CFH 90114]RXT14806.1 30S ribosomal protein S20 [Ammoniphilus sp. CFH 90114]